MIAYKLRSSCFGELWTLYVSWITYDHLYIYRFIAPWSWEKVYIFISALRTLHRDMTKDMYFHLSISMSTTPWLQKKIFLFLFQHCVRYSLITIENTFIFILRLSSLRDKFSVSIRFLHTSESDFTIRRFSGVFHAIFFLRKFSVSIRFIYILQ